MSFPVSRPATRMMPLLAMAAMLPATAWAMPGCRDMAGVSGSPDLPTLTATGEGQARVQPDIATIMVGVTVQAPTAGQAMADNAARQRAVIDLLRAEGVDGRDIQTSGLNLSPVQDYSDQGRPPVITGYQAQNMVSVTIRDLGRLGRTLDMLVGAGANEVQGISFARDDLQPTEDEARRRAVESAGHRAAVLAEAAGLQLGPLVSMSDTLVGAPPGPVMMMARAERDMASTPIEAGELNVMAQVTATYALTGTNAAGPGYGITGPCGDSAGPAHMLGPHDWHGLPQGDMSDPSWPMQDHHWGHGG